MKLVNETAVISNRIFETVLYNTFIAEEFAGNELYAVGSKERNQLYEKGTPISYGRKHTDKTG
ncbi:MAG: hypothetical protein LUH20_08990 [Lachnospiraceae bacterium]|nr:hypothetical protein [Lachnospiraceae bacterium]